MKQSKQLQNILGKIPKIFQDLDFSSLGQGQKAVAQLAQSMSQIGSDLSKIEDSKAISNIIDQSEQVYKLVKDIHPQLGEAAKQVNKFAKGMLNAAKSAQTLQKRISDVVSQQLTD